MKTNYNLLKDAYSIKNISTCQYDSLHGYVSDFSKNGDVDGWDIYSNICLYGVWDTVLFGTSLDRECYISRTNIFIPIPAESYHIMKVTMKLTLPDDLPEQFIPTKGRLMWQTVADPSWSEQKSIDFDLIVNDQWYSYIINTGESQYWQGDINNVRIYPFTDGKPEIRFTIKAINIDSTDYFQCINTQCDYYSKYSHPCEGIGKRASITSGIPKETFTTVSGLNDKLLLNIDGYGDQQINLGNFTNITGSDMAKVLVNRISLVDVGQYTYVESTFDYTQNTLIIHSGSSTEGGTISIGGPAAEILGFFNELGEDVSVETIGKSPASGFDYSASRRLKGFEINALIDSDEEHTAYYHNPNQYTVEAGRSDFIDSMSSSHAPRPIDIDYYKEIDGNNKLIIDGSHPVNDSGRLTLIKVNGTRCKDVDENMFVSSRFSSSFSKVVLLRTYRMTDVETSFVQIIYTATIEDPEKGAVHTSDDVTYSIEVDWLVNKGDLIGFYNFNVLCPHSMQQRQPNAVYFEVAGMPEGKFSIGKPAAKGVIGLSFYARSSRIQENIQLEIDLGRRANIADLHVHGEELKTDYEYNVAACLDVTWEVNLHNDTHWHDVNHCYTGVVGRKVEHRNKAYGLECLDDCITTPDNGQQGSTYTSNSHGGSLHWDGSNYIQNDDPDTYSGLVTIGEHSYFYVNGDGEWNSAECGATGDEDAAYRYMEFQSPWTTGEPYDYEFDPLTFTLLFPPGRQVKIHKTAIYFKESNNFKHLSLSYYLGEFGGNGDAEEIHWKYVPTFTSVDLDGTMLYEGLTDGERRSQQYDDIYFSNPWPWGKPEYVNGVCTNWDIYQTLMNERMNTLKHYFEPVECYGFRYHNEWHKSTKITEIEVFSYLYIEPSLLDNVSMYSSVYSNEWHELSFTADEDDDEKITAHVSGSPRYFKLEIKSQDIFKLKELNATISMEYIKDLDCYNTISADYAPKGIVTESKELIIENTYDIPLNLIVDIPTSLFKQDDILSWVRFDSEDSTINAEIGPGAIVRKNPDYPLYMADGQIANNCIAYYLKNMIDNKPSYQFINNYKWTFYKTLHHNEDVAYTNDPTGKQYSVSFDKVSSKYWKLGVFDTGRYELNSFKLYNGLSLLDNYNIYIQARTDFFSGKFKTSIDPITGNILPVSVVEDDFSNSTYLDYWDYDFGLNPGNNNLVEAYDSIFPYLDGWGMAAINKTFWPGALSFSVDIHFKFGLPSSLKYTVELLDEDERVLFTMELTGQGDDTATLDIWATYPISQEMKHLQYWGTDPMLYAGGQSITNPDSKDLIFSVEKVGNTFSYISLDTVDGANIFNTTSQLSFPDRVSKLNIRYENMSSDEYYTQTTKVSTSSVVVQALPYLSAQEFIAFDFNDSEPVDKFEIVHTQSELLKPAILIGNLDKDDYIFWAYSFAKTGDLTPVSRSIYSNNGFYNSGNNALDSNPWNLFSDAWNFYFTHCSCYVKYDFGAGNARVINYLYYTPYASTTYQTPDIVQVYGTNEYGDTFDPESSSNKLLIEFDINKYGSTHAYNEEYFTNNNYYRFLIIYWPRKEDNTWNTLLLSKKMRFGRKFNDFNPYNSITNEQEILLIHSDNEATDIEFIDSSYYSHLLYKAGAPTHSTTVAKFGNSSMYFNGGNSFIKVGEDSPASEAYFDFADNDFTIDVWIYMTIHTTYRRVCSTRSVGGTGMIVTIHANGTLYFQDTTAGIVYSSHYIPLNQWSHIAVVGHEGTIKLYLNGVADPATLVQGVLSPPDSIFIIGRVINQGSYSFYGYMDAFRVNNGRALWTEDFTPPEFIKTFENSVLTAATEEDYTNYLAIDLQQLHNVDFLRNSGPNENLKNIWNTSEIDYSGSDTANIDEVEWKGSAPVLLLNFENFTDSSESEHVLVKEGDVTISTIGSAVTPNGHAVFNGGTISIDTSGDFNLYAEEFTIDFRVLRAGAGYEGIISRTSALNSTSSFSFTFGVDDYLVATVYSGGSLFELKSQFMLSTSIWYHVALVRFNGTLGLYIDGTAHDSIYIGTAVEVNLAATPLILGRFNEAYFKGSLDEVRIIKQHAYWKHSFDPPEVAYTSTVVGDKTSARWLKIPMVCGDNIDRYLQYIGIYPEITMAYMPGGGYNCEWVPFEVPSRLTNYITSARNLAPHGTILNIAEKYYEFETSGLPSWNNLTYPVTIASGIEQTNFSGEFPDPIWESYSEDFTSLYSSISRETKALKIALTSDEDGVCSFRTKDVSGAATFEIEIDYSINHVSSSRLTTELHIYNADRSHTMYLKRELVSGSSAVIYFWKDAWYVTYNTFISDLLKEITKFKIRKHGYTFTASYFNRVDNEWVTFADHENYDFGYDDPIFFEYSVDKLGNFPENTINITNAVLTVDNTTISGSAGWGIRPIDDDEDFSCLEYLTPEVLTDFGPVLVLDDLIIGRKIQNFEFRYYNEGVGGGGFSILDSNGDEILGLATNSPEWMVKSINGWEVINDNPFSGNDSWYKVLVTFDWSAFTATITWQAVTANDYVSHTVSLIEQTNVSTFQIRTMTGRSWGLNYQKIKFDDVIITPDSYWMQDWHPYNCLSGDASNEGYEYSWGFPSIDPKPTLTLDLGGIYNVNKFVLTHQASSEATDWMNTAYTISYATSISGTFSPLVEVTGNTESSIEHYLDDAVECSFIKLEIDAYTKPAVAPIITVEGQSDTTEFITIDGGFLREFEIWQADDNIAINSQDHPVVCLDLRHAFNVTGHNLELYGDYPWEKSWRNDEEFYQYSDDPTSIANEVSFTSPAQASVPFFYSGEYLDVNRTGGPVILTSSVFLAKGNYAIRWSIYRPDTSELVHMDIIGPSSYTVTSSIVSEGWVTQSSTLNLAESGYYTVQVRALPTSLTGTWGVRAVSFENAQATSKWLALRRITAENFTYDWRDPSQYIDEDARGIAPGIDYLKKVLVYTTNHLRPTECSWWWDSGMSVLENDTINTKEGFRSLKITYPDSDRSDFIRLIEGDTFGMDDQYSFKDSLSMWLYVSDVDKLDITTGGIAFGCFEGWASVVTWDNHLDKSFDWIKIKSNLQTWNFSDMNLKTGWNRVRLRFDEYDITYPPADINTGVLDSVLNYRVNRTSSFGMVFTGKGESFHMFLDGIKIERNYFYDDVVFGDKGLCLTWGEFAEMPLSGTSLRRGAIEMWLKLYTGSNGVDIYEHVASRTIFTLINNSDECITLSIRGSHWFEIGIGNIKAGFSQLYVDALEYDLSNFTFGIGDIFHVALAWSHDGTEMSNNNTLRLFINGVECLSSNSTWGISDNKGTLLRLGGGNSYLSTNDNDDGSAIFSNVKLYNYCKEEYDLNEQAPKIYDAASSNSFLRLSADNITFYGSTSVELPMVFEAIQPGDEVKVYTKVDKTKPELYNQFTGTITVDWEVPV